jgi:hypothetical protein
MKNILLNIVFLGISVLLLVFVSRTSLKDLAFFRSKKTTSGNVVSFKDGGVQEPYRVTIQYYNGYLERLVTCEISVKKSIGNKLKGKATVLVDFGESYPCNIFLTDYKTPSIFIIFFDLVVVIILLIAVIELVRRLLISKKAWVGLKKSTN